MWYRCQIGYNSYAPSFAVIDSRVLPPPWSLAHNRKDIQAILVIGALVGIQDYSELAFGLKVGSAKGRVTSEI
jgi:hypothetical protein